MFEVFIWLLQGAGFCFVVLLIGSVAATWLRQPSDRLRGLQWSLGISLAGLILIAVPRHWMLYYQPLYWVVRRQLLVAMDQLADAEAAGEVAGRIDYAEFLIELARKTQGVKTGLALGVSSRPPAIQQRVEELLQNTTPTRDSCSKRRTAVIASIALVIGLVGSSIRLEADEPMSDEASAAKDQPKTGGTEAGEAADSDSNAASDQATGFGAGAWHRSSTDEEGRLQLMIPTPGDGVVWVFPPDHAPQALRLADRRGEWGDIQVQPGAVVRGTVLNVEGEPVANLRVELRRKGDGDYGVQIKPSSSRDQYSAEPLRTFSCEAPSPSQTHEIRSWLSEPFRMVSWKGLTSTAKAHRVLATA
ncbi:MAG: hypothetical protein AAGD07_17285 [Planctomycetota bacterium]